MSGQTRRVEIAILGAGTAGLGSWRSARRAGKSVLMIDPGPFGTTCARVGCMPSKLLIAAADAVHHARLAPTFGVHPGELRIDGRAVLARLRRERDRFVGFVREVIDEAAAGGELLAGRARLDGPGRLRVDDGTAVEYERLIIATGSRPFVPAPFRPLKEALLSNDEIFELEELPESLLVIGLGVIGLELGQAFHRLGVRTTLLGVRGAIGPISDPLILTEAQQVLGAELDLHPEHALESVRRTDAGVEVVFEDSRAKRRREHYARVLIAAGRRPNLDIGLETLGISADEAGRYPVDPDTLQLGDAPIFVAGDVNGLHPLLHEAADDGRTAGTNAAGFPEVQSAARRTPLAITFSDPQIAIVGGGYEGLGDCEAVAGEVDYGDQGRSRVHGINKGRARIYADRHSAELLGAEVFGPRAEHLGHLLAWAVQQHLTVEQALAMPFYHPVIEEGIRTALRDLAANLKRGKPIKCRVTELGVGA
ncbi:MAG: dihydrolipoyl dehydrogenase [Deltaproteobacteria bacterium]|jgi:dihydrolipoamide dehydrogenase|nr:dihydrolipoyl dehydrogenase [Deltaproteobacteria bacterium]MBW2532271.1 dihydrolipoyl dehydrogenase [Deltaproteobacteria bacterium]